MAKQEVPTMGYQDAPDAVYDARVLGKPRMVLFGFQHMFAMFGATVLVPVLTGLSVQATLLFAGLGTLLFHFLSKGKVPAFLGSSFAFIAGYAAIAPNGEPELLPYACLGVCCAGLLYPLLSALFRVFGPMSTQVWNEDSVLPFRAKLIGEIGWVDEILVQYRFHETNMSGGSIGDRRLRIAGYTNRRQPAMYQQLIDIYVAEKLTPERGREFVKMRRVLEREVYLKWLVSNWVLHPQWRLMLLCDLLFSLTHLKFFLMKCFAKILERI